MTQNSIRENLLPLANKYRCGTIQVKPVDLAFFDGENWNILELKAGGDLDSSNAPSNVEKLLTIYVDMGIENCKAYFPTLYNKDGEGNTWKGAVKKHLAYPEMFLIGKNLWKKILPNGISFEEFESIIEMLWLVADMKTVDISAFNEFGEIRNAIQHFGIVSKEKSVSYLTSLQFIYGTIDPFINESWGLFAVDYCQDYHEDSEDNSNYWNYIRECLIGNEIIFKVSPFLAENKAFWWSSIKVTEEFTALAEESDFIEPIEVSKEYYDAIKEQLQLYNVFVD